MSVVACLGDPGKAIIFTHLVNAVKKTTLVMLSLAIFVLVRHFGHLIIADTSYEFLSCLSSRFARRLQT